MDSLLISYILPLLGVVILLFCFGSFVLPYGERFKGKIQKVKAFGMDLEVSVITFFVIVGVILAFTGVYFHIQDYETRLVQAQKDRDLAKEALVLAQTMEIKAVITLENVNEDNMPQLENLQCKYFLYGDDTPVMVDVIKGYRSDQFKLILRDICPKTNIAQLVLEDLSNGKRWGKENFLPLEPVYELRED